MVSLVWWLQVGKGLPNYRNTLIQNKVYYILYILRKQKWKLFINISSTHPTFKVDEVMYIDTWYAKPIKSLGNFDIFDF
jgi:hypothetical protein